MNQVQTNTSQAKLSTTGNLLIIDGNSIINRAFWGGTKLSLEDGTPIGAIYTFFNIILRHAKDLHLSHMVIAFDLSKPTFRHQLYADYKGTRKSMDPELAIQIKLLKKVLSELNLAAISLEGYEADDLIGTISQREQANFKHIYILTGDRDSFQLIRENVSVVYPGNKGMVTFYDEAKLKEEFNCTPRSFLTYKALQGDTSDNIKGLPGVGPKTAKDIIAIHDDLETIFTNLEDFPTKLKNKLNKEDSYNIVQLAMELVTINCQSPLVYNIDDFKLKSDPLASWQTVLKKYGFLSLLEKMAVFFPMPGQTSTNISEQLSFLGESKQETPIIQDLILLDEPLTGNDLNSQHCFLRQVTSNNSGKPRDLITFSQESIFVFYDQELLYIPDLKTKCIYKLQVQAYEQLYDLAQEHNRLLVVNSIKEILQPAGSEKVIGVLDAAVYAYAQGLAFKDVDIFSLAEALDIYYQKVDLPNKTRFAKCTVDLQQEYLAAYFTTLILVSYQLLKDIDKPTLELINKIDLPIIPVLVDMEKNGIAVDKEVLLKQGQHLDNICIKLEQDIYELAGHEFNILSQQQLSAVLFEELGLKHGKKLKNGYSTSVDVLTKLIDDHEIIAKILDYRTLTKLKSTFITGLLKYLDANDRIHTTFHATLTQTGRLSSSDPNLQNIPIRTAEGSLIREAFVAEKGKLLIDADYSQIELRLLACMAEEETMISAFANGIDIHTLTAAEIFKVSSDAVDSHMRSIGKTVNFSIVYGISDYGLGRDLGVDFYEAHKYIANYHATYPKVQTFMLKQIDSANRKGYVETLYNRKRYIKELKSGNYQIRQFGERAAMNTPIQGTASDIIKLAMINLYARLKKENLQAKIVLQIHDELILEVDADVAEYVAEILVAEMQNAAHLTVPLTADVAIGKNWLEVKG